MKYEIWLGDDGTYFDHGTAHFEDGHTDPLGAFCNVSIYRNSLLIGTANQYGEIDDKLRWYPKEGVIHFYFWAQDLEGVVFHNGTGRDIYIYGHAYLKHGESAEVNQRFGTKHADWLRCMTPIGLGRLVETSHTEDDYPNMIGKYGLILARPSRRDLNKNVVRFVLAACLRGEDLETEGFETGAGKVVFDGENQFVLETENSRYVFVNDKGDV